LPIGPTQVENGIWGSGPDDVYIVGYATTIYHWNGTTLSAISPPGNQVMHGIWGSSASDVFAVGETGAIWHFNGTTWTSMTSPTNVVTLYGVAGTYAPPGVALLPRFDIPFLDGIPVLGALSHLDALTWGAWALVPLTAFALHRTRWGLRLRATGSSEATVRAVGLAPLSIRDVSTTIAGALAGLAGAHLSIGVVGLFNEGITGGRGFIALAAFYFGRESPWRTALGALLFGFFEAAQIRLQGHGLPADIVQTLPYVIVIIVLTGLGIADRARARTS